MTRPVESRISINNLVAHASLPKRAAISALDKMLGIAKMNRLYHLHQMQGLSKEEFADKLIELLDLSISGIAELQAKIPATGPVVIASNHPFGGIEGVILARVIGQIRPDLKVLANKGLGIFKELSDYFIFTNPLSEKDPSNGPSLRKCISHVKNEGALLIFPAGRVAYYQADKKAILDHSWNKIVGRLINIDGCQFVPVFVSGNNSKWFYRLGRIYYRLRMLMLARELLNKTNASVGLHAGNAVAQHKIKAISTTQSQTANPRLQNQLKANFCRGLVYTQDPNWCYQWPSDEHIELKPLMAPISRKIIEQELLSLAQGQLLIDTQQYAVYYAYQAQCPMLVQEIARLREMVFRQHNEGSGEALDTDSFDATYTHLFIVDKNCFEIVGAYRMGQTDTLLQNNGLKGLYLQKMFNFDESFVNRQQPCLEMGRSFLVPKMQGSYQGLLLLWRGICAFALKYPQYRTLYGTVSISKLYQARSVKLIEKVLIDDEDRMHVSAKNPFDFKLHPELNELAHQQDLKPNLGAMLATIESDGKDIPILAKQYMKMGAKFHALGIDKSFNHTPGLLLSVHLPSAPKRQLKLYFGEQFEDYLQYDSDNNFN